MLKQIICISLLLAVPFAFAFQKTDLKATEKEMSGMIPISMTLPNDSGRPAPLSQALASFTPGPFGRYTENINGVSLELVRMPTGTFLMGNDHSPNPEEKPAHQVNVRSFYIGQYEITRQQWNIVVDTLPKVSRNLGRQVVDPAVSQNFQETTPADALFWEDAAEFCERLTRFTGKKYRLPSEAEWEYACRAGTQTEYSFGDKVDYNLADFRDVTASYSPSYWILPVGTKGYTNVWGLYDMHGNVAEWCLDVEHPNYIGAPTDGRAWTEGGDQSRRSQRGGQYSQNSEIGRSSARRFWSRGFTVSGNGFRVAAEISPITSNGSATAISAASYSGTTLATESIAALFGSNLSNETQAASALPLPTTLAGASVNLKDSSGNEYLAPLFFTSPGQINFQIPPGLALGPGTVSVVSNGNISATGPLEITSVNPGLFTADASGKGLGAALVLRVRSNGEQVYEPVARYDAASNRFLAEPIDVSNPAEQVYLILFGTGFRQHSSPAGVQASIDGVIAEVLFAGAQGSLIGVDQCNLRLPQSFAGRGDVNVSLNVDGQPGNTIQIRVK